MKLDRKSLILGISAISLVSGLGLTNPAIAQQAPQDNDGEAIIVTAQKRAQNIVEVPTAVTAIGSEELAARDVTDFTNIQDVAPSVTIQGEGANGSVTIRGIGTSVYTTSAEAAVLTVIDDLAVLQAGQAFDALSDVERVEVLRGPQGTLFGKGASAGVISIVTRGPTDRFRADFSSQIVDDGRFNLQVGAGGPLADGVGLRVSGYYNDNKGLVRNRVTGNTLGDQKGFGFRTKLRLDPTETLRFDLNYSHAEAESTSSGATLRTVPANTVLPFGVVLNNFLYGVVPGPDNKEVARDVDGYLRTNTDVFSLKGELDLGFASLISISGYQDWRNDLVQDLDGTAAPVFGSANGIVQGGPYVAKLFSQELRLVSSGTGPLKYLVGAYYADGNTDRSFVRSLTTPLAAKWDSTAGTTTKAVFAEASYMLPSRTELTAGVRYNQETITAEYLNMVRPANPPANNQTCLSLCTGRNTDDVVTYRLSVRQELTPRVSVYASYATGYKGAAFDLATGFTATKAANPARPETSRAYELGLRGSILDGLAQVGLTGFLTNYDDFQRQAIVIATDPTQPTENRLTNVGKLQTKGVELELRTNPARGLQVNGYLSYIDAIIRKFPEGPCYLGQTAAQGCVDPDGAGGKDPFQDLAGARLNGVSKWSYNIFARYEFDTPSVPFDPFVQVDWSYRSSVQEDIAQNPTSITQGYSLLDGAFGVKLRGSNITATLFVNNLLDKSYLSGGFAGAFFPVTVTSNNIRRDQSRVFGFRLTASY